MLTAQTKTTERDWHGNFRHLWHFFRRESSLQIYIELTGIILYLFALYYCLVAVPHTCSFACSRSSSRVSIDPLKHNPLAVPILMDWKREIVKRRGKTNKRDVYYRTPCNRRLRNMPEVMRYLQLTGESSLNVDHFTFDWRVRTDNVVAPVRQTQC